MRVGAGTKQAVKLNELKTSDEVLKEELRDDPEFRAEWERTALARAVAVRVITYRSQHGLSQRALAERLGMKQPQVARLERGDVTPTIETLMRLAGALDVEFVLGVHPVNSQPKLLTKRAQTRDLVTSYENETSGVVFAAG